MMRVSKKSKILITLLLAVIAVFSFAGCFLNQADDNVGTQTPTITVNQAVISIKPYETFDIIAKYSGDGELAWSSSNSAVATVDGGRVVGVSVGQAVITVSAGDCSKNCYVTVLPNSEVPTLTVTNTDNGIVQLNLGDEYNLNVKAKFSNQEVEATFKFVSSDEDVVSVDANGKLTANTVGEACVFVSGSWREFDENAINTTIKVVVKADVSFDLIAEREGIYAVSILDGENFIQQTQLTPNLKINGESCTSGFTFDSSDSSVVSVNAQGVAIGHKVGQSTVTCYYQHGEETLFASTVIEVLPIVKDKQLAEPFTLELSEGTSASVFDEVFADGKETVKIIDVTEKSVAVKLDDNNVIVNDELLSTGERVWEVYNEAYAYRIDVLVADYVIGTAKELKEVLPTDARKLNAYIILSNDIANVGDYSGWRGFSGTFDGKGHVISDINIKSRGLFGMLDGGAIIKNVAISNVTLSGTSGVFGVQADSATIDNVSVWISGVAPTDIAPCGGLVYQIGGVLNVRNTLVYAMGVNGLNFGAVTGAWWNGEYNLTNSYFITDGTPCGKVYKTSSKDNDNAKGVLENSKGSWNYIYADRQAFEQELVKENGKVNLVGFDKNIWDISQKTMPIFKNDQGFKAVLSEKVNGSKNGGELFYFSKNVTTPAGYASKYVEKGYYKIALPEAIKGTVTAVNLGANAVENFAFDASSKTLKIPVSALNGVSCGQYNVLISTTDGTYRCEVTVADSVLYNGADVRAVLNNQETLGASGVDNDVYIILDGDIAWDWTIFPSGWGKHLYGTIDGKGYAITDMRVTAYLFHTIQGGSKIKNIAFLNVSYGGDSSFLCVENGAFTVENVAITYSAGVCVGLVKSMVGNVVVRNTILVCNSTTYGYVDTYNSAKTLTLDNSYCVTSTGAIKTPTSTEDTNYINAQATVCSDLATLLAKSENLKAFSSDYWSVENGSVLFGGNVVISK